MRLKRAINRNVWRLKYVVSDGCWCNYFCNPKFGCLNRKAQNGLVL